MRAEKRAAQQRQERAKRQKLADMKERISEAFNHIFELPGEACGKATPIESVAVTRRRARRHRCEECGCCVHRGRVSNGVRDGVEGW